MSKSQEEAAQAGSGAPGSRTRQDRCIEQPGVCQRPTNLRPRDSRVRRLVLCGARPRVQPHRRAPVPDSPRITQICAGHDQSSARRGPADRVRGSGRRSIESRAGGRHPSGEGRATDRCAPRELADTRAGPAASGVRDALDGARITGSRDGRDVDWVRSVSRQPATLRREYP
jgi:hypothetical protein